MPTNEEHIQRAKRKALENDFHSGCSQSVLGALQEEFGVGNKESFKAATVLSRGVVRQGETCGAIIGALSALGLVIGREREELKKQFGFEEELKSTLCRDIQEKVLGRFFYLADEEERQAFLDAGGHSETKCPKVCGIAAQVAAEKILELI